MGTGRFWIINKFFDGCLLWFTVNICLILKKLLSAKLFLTGNVLTVERFVLCAASSSLAENILVINVLGRLMQK